MDSQLQEFLPVLVLVVLGLFAGIVGFFFAVRERREHARRAENERARRELDSNLQKTA